MLLLLLLMVMLMLMLMLFIRNMNMEKKLITLVEKQRQLATGGIFYHYEVSTLRNTCEFHIGEVIKPAKVRTMCMDRDSYRVTIRGNG